MSKIYKFEVAPISLLFSNLDNDTTNIIVNTLAEQ